MRAEHYLARPVRAGRAEQQVPGRGEVEGVAVVALAGQPVIAMLAGMRPGMFEVIQRRPQRGTAQLAQCRRARSWSCLLRTGRQCLPAAVPARGW
jgi:hypothetical protein